MKGHAASSMSLFYCCYQACSRTASDSVFNAHTRVHLQGQGHGVERQNVIEQGFGGQGATVLHAVDEVERVRAIETAIDAAPGMGWNASGSSASTCRAAASG
ncbi:hypothetical protein D3C84_777940 [compost metagenome]